MKFKITKEDIEQIRKKIGKEQMAETASNSKLIIKSYSGIESTFNGPHLAFFKSRNGFFHFSKSTVGKSKESVVRTQISDSESLTSNFEFNVQTDIHQGLIAVQEEKLSADENAENDSKSKDYDSGSKLPDILIDAIMNGEKSGLEPTEIANHECHNEHIAIQSHTSE